MKLTAQQIGRIAGHIEKAIKENPIEPKEDLPKEVVGLDAWEDALKRTVDGDDSLRFDYQQLCDEHANLLELLIDYLAC